MPYEFKSVFKKELADYVGYKRSLGFKFESGEKHMAILDRYFVRMNLDEKVITKELCEDWCAKRSYETNTNRADRIGYLSTFCKYLSELGYSVHMPRRTRRVRRVGYEAHIFTADELRRFFAAVDKSKPVNKEAPWRHLTMPIYFRILYSSGLRLSELALAKIEDMDFEKNALTVRMGKNNKDRIVPIHPELVKKCADMLEVVSRTDPERDYLFKVRPGVPFNKYNVYKNFRRYLEKAGISHLGRGKGPRVHDLRHTYCVHLLWKWIREGRDLLAWLPYMRTMLGHSSFEETAYYLKLTSQMFPDLRDRLDATYPNLVEAIPDEEPEFY